MNKKLILSVTMLFCVNTIIFSAQNLSTASTAGIVQPLTAEESRKYQELVKVYKSGWNWSKVSSSTSIPIANISEALRIVKKRTQFLEQQMSQPSTIWPYWLVASFIPVLFITEWIGKGIKNIGNVIEKSGSDLGNKLWWVGNFIDDVPSPIWQSMSSISKALGMPGYTIGQLAIVAPLIAFYGLYRKYSTREQQLQELNILHGLHRVLMEQLNTGTY